MSCTSQNNCIAEAANGTDLEFSNCIQGCCLGTESNAVDFECDTAINNYCQKHVRPDVGSECYLNEETGAPTSSRCGDMAWQNCLCHNFAKTGFYVQNSPISPTTYVSGDAACLYSPCQKLQQNTASADSVVNSGSYVTGAMRYNTDHETSLCARASQQLGCAMSSRSGYDRKCILLCRFKL